jgi:hypothetical protein
MSIRNIVNNNSLASWINIRSNDVKIDQVLTITGDVSIENLDCDEILVTNDTLVNNTELTAQTFINNEIQITGFYNPFQTLNIDISLTYGTDIGLTLLGGAIFFKFGNMVCMYIQDVQAYDGNTLDGDDKIFLQFPNDTLPPAFIPLLSQPNEPQEIGYTIFNNNRDLPSTNEIYLSVVYESNFGGRFLIESINEGDDLSGTGNFKFQFPAGFNGCYIANNATYP